MVSASKYKLAFCGNRIFAAKKCPCHGESGGKMVGLQTWKYSRNLSGIDRDKRMKEGQLMTSHGNQGAAAKLAKNSVQGLKELENMLAESPSPERVSSKLAQILNVARNEVAVLRLEKGCLRFVFPPELRAAGMIPVSSSAVAARTAATGTSLLSNSFARVNHVRLSESVKLGAKDDNQASEQMPIQKIMSVPVAQPGGKIIGVIQVSRKGLDSSLAGGDFTSEDLKRLEQAATVVARMPFMEEGTPVGESAS